jgi:hypothetical protein
VGELSVRAVHVAPLVVELHDLGHLVIEQAVQRAAAGGAVGQLAALSAPHPAVRPHLFELELTAGAGEAPAGVGGGVEQFQEGLLGGRIDSERDLATQPQRPFPSTSINLTAISLSASPRRTASARAASSS